MWPTHKTEKEQQLENQAKPAQIDSAGSGSAQGTKRILVMQNLSEGSS